MSYGWIYLRKNVNLKGEVMAYCIGKTGNEKKRRKTYRKENPFIEHVEDYEAYDMYTAETILRDFIEDNDMQLVGRSKEWLRKECFEEFYQQWQEVKGHYWVDRPKKPKPPKRKPLQPLGAGAVKPLPPVGKPRPLGNRTEKEHLLAYAQEAAFAPPPVPLTDTTAESIAAATKQPAGLWWIIGEFVSIVFFCAVVMGVMGLVFWVGNLLTAIIPLIVFAGILWVLGTLSGTGKRRRRRAW